MKIWSFSSIKILQYVAAPYLKGVAAAKHPRLGGNIWRDRNYSRHSCVVTWKPQVNIVLNSWRQFKKTRLFLVPFQLEKSCWSCRKSYSALKEERLWRCALETEPRADSDSDSSVCCCSCPVKSQGVRKWVTTTEPSGFLPRGNPLFALWTVWIMHVSLFKGQLEAMSVQQSVAIIFFSYGDVTKK